MNPENSPKVAATTATGDSAAVASVLHYPGFEVDIARGELRVAGRAVALRPKTFALLTYVTQHPGRLLARDELIQAVWRDVIVTDDSLVQCISELRSALGDHRQQVIRTLPHRGYMLELRPVIPTAPREAAAIDSGSPVPSSESRAPPQPDGDQRYVRCTRCGRENAVGASFCEQCGSRLTRMCPNCGHELSPSAQFCRACGAPVDPSPPPVHYTPPHLAERILAEQAALDARGATAGERKTITVLFADLVDSTALLHDLDPEEAYRLIAPVIELMMESVHHYEGYVAKSLGDGILALFGAPIAHEDHPQRALYAALRMQDGMRRHSDRTRLEQGIAPQVRVGIHTGEVVVRSIRKDDLRTDYDPVGYTIHIASRMQTIAAPSSILVSERTHKVAEGYFEFRAMGDAQVKGIPEPLAVYEVLGLGALRTRLQVAQRRGLARFVGRQAELEQLHRALEQATAGRGQMVAVVGEAGVGKSRLLLEFKERSRRGCLVLETFSVSHGKAFAYLPLIELLRNYFQITAQDDEQRCRQKVTDQVLALERGLEGLLPYLLYLLGISESGSSLADMDPQIRRGRTFEAITRLLVRESLNQPIELLFEDLQWLDAETEAFLVFFIERLASARILVLVNYRPEYQHGWGHKSYYTQLRVDPLGQVEAQGLLSALLGHDSGLTPLKQLILEKTEGNPFFIEEVVKTLAEEKVLLGEPGNYRIEKTPTALHVPSTVQCVLAARMDRLPTAEKALLQTLAVVGKEFPWSLIQAVVQQPEDELRRLLSHLQAAEFVYERPTFPEVEYTFKHALTQEVAGSSLLAEQRSVLHERTAQSIEALYPTRLKDYWSELAHHYSASGNIPKAVQYLHSTGQQAIQRSANPEAIRHLGAALVLLKRLPDMPERARQELTLQLTLGPALIATRGYGASEVEATYTRALSLCEQAGETPQRFSVQVGLRAFYQLRARYETAKELGELLLTQAEHAQDPVLLVEAHRALGTTLFRLGESGIARAHLEQVLALYDPEHRHAYAFVYGMDPGIRCLNILALNLWCLGYPEHANKRSQEALALARKMSHPLSLAQCLVSRAELHQLQGQPRLTLEFAEAAIALSSEQGFSFYSALGTILRGSAMTELGSSDEGTAQIRQGLTAYRATGAELGRSYFLALLASAYGNSRQVHAGLGVLAEALTMVEKSGERYYEAELHRLEGELMLQGASIQTGGSANAEEAEMCFHKAIAVAHRQDAKSLELRAMLSLARLWQRQGKTAAARQGLSEIHDAFTEGFETADLRQAKVLLDELSG
ncbi:AAA family ATPase [Paraburkholderia panacisoli]|uniref:AAA family ATPase n=1 Tax=Paraburkholderia panacisoli TaxID=2603818 RepID=A0A5B0G265_9BURK|nr:adenylate/guanylate cyclase domain-containing protein [Paraburkholderia panacisoli]KAA0996100.1 AAA family ATPase [Paraburkholderia panacisoli]